jgi:hypothetical protein
MTNRTRYFVLGSISVLLVGLCTGLIAYYTGMPMGALGQAQGPQELRYVPADAAVVAYANVQDVMRSELRSKLHQTMPDHDKNGQAEFEQATGIDIERDIDRVVGFMQPIVGEKYSGMVIATGRFDVGRLESLAREHHGTIEDYKGKRIITKDIEDDDADEGPTEKSMTIAFLDTGVIAVGETATVKAAIDRQGAQSILENGELMELVKDIDDANAWAVGRFDALISQARLPQEVTSRIPAVRWFSASGHINGGVSGLIRAEARDEQAAQNLRDVVQGFVALARMQSNSQPELQSMINSLQLSGTGTTVALSFQVPTSVFDSIGAKEHPVEE